MSWCSARGRHRPFTGDGERFLELLTLAGAREGTDHKSGVYHLEAFPDLEIRVGGRLQNGRVKQLQSVAPPTIGTDGDPREWDGIDTVAELPEAAYATLEAIAE